MPESINPRRLTFFLVIALLLVFFGGLLAWWVQTAGGNVRIEDVRFTGTDGTQMSALLYIPPGATSKTPAPGILAVHGYINSRETQDGFAIEFARRGYVVLAMDQTGHGYSDPPAFSNGFGGPDGLTYLRSLDFVDKNNIGLEGHSMGGWTILAAANAFPDEYKSIVLEGSSTGAPYAAEGTTTWPHNLAVVYSQWDEFSDLMWGVPTGAQVVNSAKLAALFGTTAPVQAGQLYGSVADGTARELFQPRGTHPNDHISTEAIGDAISWMQTTLSGGSTLASIDQVWYWKEIGTFIALLGGVLFLFTAGGLLLTSSFFKSLREPMPEFKGGRGAAWWIGALCSIAIPALTFFWLQDRGTELLPASAFFPQTITSGIMVWAVGNGIISLVLLLIWRYQTKPAARPRLEAYGVTGSPYIDFRQIGKSLLFSITVIAGFYMLLLISDALFKTDFRLWILAFKPMDFLQAHIALAYVIPFGFFFLVTSTVLNSQLRLVKTDGTPVGMGRSMVVNSVLLAGGIVVMLLIQYIPLMAGNPLPLGESLLTIVGIQFVPLLIISALILTYFFHKTGRIYTGAFICAMLIASYIVAGQAIQFAFH